VFCETDTLETLLKSTWNMIRLDSAGQWLRQLHLIVNPYCFGANYLMNLIRGACTAERTTIEIMHLYSLDGFVRWKSISHPLIARLKGREAEMDYPEEGEKSAFIPAKPNRARDFSQRISGSCRFTFAILEKCVVHLCTMYRARVIYRFRQCIIFRQYNISNVYKNIFSIIII